MEASKVFDAEQIADELEEARAAAKEMVRGALGVLGGAGGFTMNHLAFLAFVERAQAFHQGAVDMVKSGNPLAAATLLRSFAENLAVVFYVERHPHEFEKLHPGAKQGLPMGRVVAAAQRRLPGFKQLYDHLSSMAHPSGAGAYQTFQIGDGGAFRWQSNPTFRSLDDARQFLKWLAEIRELTARVIRETASVFNTVGQTQTQTR